MNANAPGSTNGRPTPLDRFGLNRLLQIFLTIIAGTIVAVIAWTVIARFMHIIVLLIASFVVAYLLHPFVERMVRGGVKRPLAIAVVYVIIFIVIGAASFLLIAPLTNQLQGLIATLPSFFNTTPGQPSALDQLLRQHHITLPVSSERLRTQLAGLVTNAANTLLTNTLGVVTGIITTATDVLLILAITFYLLLDGHAMHNRAVRLLPVSYRERWFFFEATLNKVLGGYLRGQLIVATSVGFAAGAGCYLMGVRYPLVIGLLAFVFELIPMIGPVLGMIPAVIIALFQPWPLVLWVIVYFIVLQQVESNLIVPRVSGHAVGLHPLAALLALLVGVELGGLGGALLSVPLAGVLWVMAMALYADATGQAHLIDHRPRPAPAYVSFARQAMGRRREPNRPAARDGNLDGPVPVTSDRLSTIRHEQEHLMERFAADEERQQAAEPAGHGPDDPHAPAAV